MKELPYFKFYPNQWITGSIAFMKLDIQGAFIKACCFYWSKGCEVTEEQLKSIIPEHYKLLMRNNLFKVEDNKIRIKWLDEQLDERILSHKKRVEAGRKGGKVTQNKQSLSNAQALKEEKKRKDNKDPYLTTTFIK